MARPACPFNVSDHKAHLDFLGYFEREEIREKVFARDPPFCVWCNDKLGNWRSENPFSVDHIVPRSKGGLFCLENLVLSCKPCNSSRGNRGVIHNLLARARRSDHSLPHLDPDEGGAVNQPDASPSKDNAAHGPDGSGVLRTGGVIVLGILPARAHAADTAHVWRPGLYSGEGSFNLRSTVASIGMVIGH